MGVRASIVLAGVVAASCAASTAQAAGFYLQEQSARGVGRAFSGEAADTGPESLWWNPAAIGGSAERSAYVGVSGIIPSGDVSDTGTIIVRPGQAPASVGGEPVAHGPLRSGVLPSGALAIPVGGHVDLGLALTAPFDFTTEYDAQSWSRYAALRTRLRTYDLQPSIAFAPTPFLRLGVALNAEYSDATLGNALPNLSPLLPDGSQTLTGHGWDFGWSAGVQLHSDSVTVGLSYKSSIDHTLSGQVAVAGLLGPLAANNLNLATQASFRTPWQLIVGARLRATPQLTLDVQAVRAGWSRFDAIRLGAPFNTALPEGYRDTWSFAGGADYALGPSWTLRGGVQYDETPTQDGLRDARVPDANRVNLALGADFHASHAFTLEAGASYVLFDDASIDRPTAAYVGTPVQTPVLTSGKLTGAHAVVLSVGGRFSF